MVVLLGLVFHASAGPSDASMAGSVFKDCDVCPQMVVIPPGQFKMGDANGEQDETPVHEVAIPAMFAMGRTEITRAQWQAIMGANPEGVSSDCENCPVILVDWEDAQEFCRRLSQRTRQHYRLPTEAEWEYSARAGTSSDYYWGDDQATLLEPASSRSWRWGTIAPVGRFDANPFGLYDMAGSVWEWTQDCYQSNYENASDIGDAYTDRTCTEFVVRGGAYVGAPIVARSAERIALGMNHKDMHIGLRVVRELR